MRKFLVLACLILWLGGIVFFAAAVAPNVFSVLSAVPNGRHSAGDIVNRTLTTLHWMGMAAGVILIACLLAKREPAAERRSQLLLVSAMLLLTGASQFVLIPRMAALRAQLPQMDRIPPSDPLRKNFDRLHHLSTDLEITVLCLGIGVTALTARRMS